MKQLESIYEEKKKYDTAMKVSKLDRRPVYSYLKFPLTQNFRRYLRERYVLCCMMLARSGGRHDQLVVVMARPEVYTVENNGHFSKTWKEVILI